MRAGAGVSIGMSAASLGDGGSSFYHSYVNSIEVEGGGANEGEASGDGGGGDDDDDGDDAKAPPSQQLEEVLQLVNRLVATFKSRSLPLIEELLLPLVQ